MAIGATMREDGKLKLVHPGGYMEVHTEPITAAQVMDKNPRHCITRPDIFKFPWIVVRPESILQLGRVFYIVPNHTIHRLLHGNSHHQSPSLQKHQASRHHDHYRQFKKQYQVISSTEVSPKSQQHDQHLKCKSSDGYQLDLHKQQFPCESFSKTSKHLDSDGHINQQSTVQSQVMNTPKINDHARHYRREVRVKSYPKATLKQQDYYRDSKQFQSWAKVTPLIQGSAMPNSRIEMTPKQCIRGYRIKRKSPNKHSSETNNRDQYHVPLEQKTATSSWHKVTMKEGHRKRFKEHSEVDPGVQEIPSHARTHDTDDSSGGGSGGLESPTKQDKGLPELKSCLQKEGSDRRSRNLRVTFSLPSENAGKAERSWIRFFC